MTNFSLKTNNYKEQTKGYIDDERDDERDENVAYAKQINLTPKSKTQKEMRELRLEENLIGTPKRIRKKINLVKKKILAANTLSAEITSLLSW